MFILWLVANFNLQVTVISLDFQSDLPVSFRHPLINSFMFYFALIIRIPVNIFWHAFILYCWSPTCWKFGSVLHDVIDSSSAKHALLNFNIPCELTYGESITNSIHQNLLYDLLLFMSMCKMWFLWDYILVLRNKPSF